jgi:hypothetical protein
VRKKSLAQRLKPMLIALDLPFKSSAASEFFRKIRSPILDLLSRR